MNEIKCSIEVHGDWESVTFWADEGEYANNVSTHGHFRRGYNDEIVLSEQDAIEWLTKSLALVAPERLKDYPHGKVETCVATSMGEAFRLLGEGWVMYDVKFSTYLMRKDYPHGNRQEDVRAADRTPQGQSDEILTGIPAGGDS